jgi:hypothetical protein
MRARDQQRGGHLPPTYNKLIRILLEFVSWLSRREGSEEEAPKPSPTDSRYS